MLNSASVGGRWVVMGRILSGWPLIWPAKWSVAWKTDLDSILCRWSSAYIEFRNGAHLCSNPRTPLTIKKMNGCAETIPSLDDNSRDLWPAKRRVNVTSWEILMNFSDTVGWMTMSETISISTFSYNKRCYEVWLWIREGKKGRGGKMTWKSSPRCVFWTADKRKLCNLYLNDQWKSTTYSWLQKCNRSWLPV